MKKFKFISILIILFSLIISCGSTEAEPEVKVESPFPPMPEMPVIGNDLFEDGVAEVQLEHATDGDTAAFIVNGEVYDTRFLAVNTPETSHPTYGAEPWGFAAKKYATEILENAGQIVLELDAESDIFDAYDRLLAWVWVDGELLNYKLVEQGYAWVMYLYGDYKYNTTMMKLEAEVRKTKIRIHGEDDPDYDYEKVVQDVSIAEARNLETGTMVKVTGVVTAKIGNNVFIQNNGHGVYCYASNYKWRYFQPGTEVDVTAMISEYNGLFELSNIEAVELVNENVEIPVPALVTLSDIDESFEGSLVLVENVTIGQIQEHTGKGYSVEISQENGKGIIRVDKYLIPYINEDFFITGSTATITAVVGQYLDEYQLMLSLQSDLIYE